MTLPVRHSAPALLMLLVFSLTSVGAQTATLRDITVTPASDHARITFLLDGAAAVVVIEQKGRHTAQVRMKSLAAGPKALTSALAKPGVVSIKARIERADVLVTDVIFDRPVASLAVATRQPGKIVVRVLLKATTASERGATGSVDRAKTGGHKGGDRGRWSLSTIVIDAGHGGKDPGAIGLGNLQEKDVVLEVAHELKRRIRLGMPDVRVVMTRSDDSFVELYRRGRIANENDGRLFVSIHCNSMPTRPNPVSGHEVYILRPGRSAEAVRVAATENEAITFEGDRSRYSDGADTEIMAAMAQNAFVRLSEEAADRIREGMRGATRIPDRGVHQAGFLVLVGASMPAVLIELGYLTNEQDARILKSAAGRKALAGAIYSGIRSYRRYYSASISPR